MPLFVIYDESRQRVPIKVWLEHKGQLEEECLQQALNLASLPFVYKWVALMPDAHSGYGMPIGGVIAAENVIIPNAVGVDIGCGVGFVETNISKEQLSKEEYEDLVRRIMRRIPTGFRHHKKKQKSQVLDDAVNEGFERYQNELVSEIDRGYFQIGTLGGGNHFIELQEDEKGMLCVMVHSGSRNFGYKIARYYNNIAKKLSGKWEPHVPPKYDLAFLPVDVQQGKEYIEWMNLALDFARENRQIMMEVVKDELMDSVKHITFKNEVNAHHNYAALEKHYGKNVWVHRKGAICVRKGMLGIVPGAMGSYSYIVEGLGNPESFYSCSHGAGRQLSRTAARREFSVESVMQDLKERDVILGKVKKRDVAEEFRMAYKDIDFVIGQELDLIKPIKKLKTIAVLKG
jgi:tRNA-splicing ligase RtcB